MKVRFLGPIGKVTGSCTWLWDEGREWSFLVDCGMQQGEVNAQKWNLGEWPFEPRQLKFVVLTHAHIDHCGLLPTLYKRGFKGKVYCTRETAKLATLLLKDAARLSDLGYSAQDVDANEWHEPGHGGQLFGKFHPVGQDLFLRFYRSGHVIGAVSVAVHWGAPQSPDQRSIIFSGDLGPNVQDVEALPFLRHRMGVCSHDYAVVESTYGAMVREPSASSAQARRDRLAQLLDQTLHTGGTLVIPSFSFGRTQDILFDLHWLIAQHPDRYGEVPVFMDSPTARKMHGIVFSALGRTENNGRKGKVRPLWLGKQMFRWFGLDAQCPSDVARAVEICAQTLGIEAGSVAGSAARGNDLARAWRGVLQPLMSREDIGTALAATASVLIVSSGTCDGGPAAYWLPQLLGDQRNTVALAGFCSPATIGGRLLAMANLPEGERRRLSAMLIWAEDQTLPEAAVRASITQLEGYSAHADRAGLLDWVFGELDGPAGKTVFIQHGTETGRMALEQAIQKRSKDLGAEVTVIRPASEQVFDLDRAGQEAIDSDHALREIERQMMALEILRKNLRGY